MIDSPGEWLITLCGIGVVLLWTGRVALGRSLLSIAVLCFGLIAVLPVEEWALRPLEERFPQPTELTKVDGIVVLGGAINGAISIDRLQPQTNDEADRMLQFVVLAHAYPNAKLVFTGGPLPSAPAGAREADVAENLFTAMGIDPQRIQYESESRTTFENAAFTGETWLLVTSAAHMPRAIGTFRTVGLDLLAYPAGYKSFHGNVTHQYGLIDRLHLLHIAAHEWIGLVVYRLRGQSSALFPAPEIMPELPHEKPQEVPAPAPVQMLTPAPVEAAKP